MKTPCTYILASKQNGVLYVGVTSDIYKRMSQHAQGLIPGFTKDHDIKMLVYYEFHISMNEAIAREKLLKKWHRPWKLRLIESMNPEWKNLYNAANGEVSPGPADILRFDL